MSIRRWFIVVLLLAVVSANAQFRKIPAEVTDAFKAKFADATGVSWKDKLSSFQAEFKEGDKERKAMFNSKGEWQKTETKYNYDKLPASVKDGFKKSKYADRNVSEVVQIDESDKETKFRVVVKKNDYNKKNLIFSKAGQLISDNALL